MVSNGINNGHERRAQGSLGRRAGVVLLGLLSVLAVLLAIQPAMATDVGQEVAQEFPLVLSAQKDSYVDQSNPSANYGSSSALYVSRNSGGDERHTLLYFDTGSLPDNIVVTSATLELYSQINAIGPTAPAQNNLIQARAIVSGWRESLVTWNNRPPSTYLGDPAVSYDQQWLSFDVTNIAQAWAGGSVENYGILLAPHKPETTSGFFFDRSNGALGPRLTITYEEAPPPCTPIEDVALGGATRGHTGAAYEYDVALSPAGATGPFTYSWSGTDQAAGSDPTATYQWATTGQQNVSVTVENCGGNASDTMEVTIESPNTACTALGNVTLEGPLSGATNRQYGFTAVATPNDASTPVTFEWWTTDKGNGYQSGDLLASDRTLLWTWAGTKQHTVTVDNCGATFVRHHFIDIGEPSSLPDLTVGAPWYDALQGSLGYIVRNVGQGDAPGGHTMSLSNDEVEVATATVEDTIPGGGVRAGQFGDVWSCAGEESLLTLRADDGDVVVEGDETNNAYNAPWPCDLRAPAITSGPTVVNKSATTATIEWTTDEVTSGRLEYGLTAYSPTGVDSEAQDTTHSVALSNLQPGTTYRMRAFAQDGAGQAANSDWVYFETNTPGEDPPTIFALETTYLADHDYDSYILRAELDAAAYVDRVEFYLDGAHVGSDYTTTDRYFGVYLSPAELGYTPQSFFGQAHTLEARAYTTTGFSSTDSVQWQPDPRPAPIFLKFWKPEQDEQIEVDGDRAPTGATTDARVMAVETDWKCSWGGSVPNSTGRPPVDCADANLRPVQALRLRLNGVMQEVVEPVPDLTHDFTVDLSNRFLQQHTLQVTATGSDGEQTALERKFELVRGDPNFSYERSVSREDNVFEISLTVRNEGNATARVHSIRDALHGFQPIHRDYLPGQVVGPTAPGDVGAWYTVRGINTWYDVTILEVDLSSTQGGFVRLPPGESFTVTFYAAPILYPDGDFEYHIGARPGGQSRQLRYRDDYGGAPMQLDHFYASGAAVQDAELGGLVTLHQSVMAAVNEADYVIVTDPYGLAVFASDTGWAGVDPGEERQRLHSDLAELASLADGVLAYYAENDGALLDDLLEPGGYWYESLHPNFRQTLQGYVLLVGEHEVLPTQAAGYDVAWSDLRYASTGGDARPELVLGRLVGDDVATLRQPLDAAIRYHKGLPVFDHSHALLYSGRMSGEGSFWDSIKDIDSRLPDTTDVTRIRSESINTSQEIAAFLDNTTNRDIIVYRGHGYTSGDGFAISEETGIGPGEISSLDGFGNTRPFMMALACSAGDYEEDDDYGIAEASLREGAAVFIGSTGLSYRYRNNEAARWFFNRFIPERSVGDVFAKLLRDKFNEWSWGDEVSNMTTWGRWSYQYQLYGDPKYGRLAPGSGAPAPVLATELQGSDTLNVTLGPPDVSDDDGWHIVSFPEGDHLQGPGQYVLPVQQVVAHYPPGVRVQDVQLSVRSGLVVTTSLNIPISYFRQDADGVLQQYYAADAQPDDGWQPALEQPFRWRVAENADGSSDLILFIYPFSYNPSTTDARYYLEWGFEVETIATSVTAQPLELGANSYGLGDVVTATLTVENSGSAQAVIVSPVVRDLQGNEVAGLPLRTLHGVQGEASYTLEWDSSGVPAGDYVLEAALLDEQGHELDKVSEFLTLGLVRAEGVSLEAGAYPGEGSGVPLTLRMRNSGDTTIDGKLHLRVENVDTGEVVATFSQPAANFAPGSEMEMDAVWDDAGAPWARYRAVGYLHYNGTISEPLIAV